MRSVLFENAVFERNLFWKFKKQTAIRSGKWKLFNSNELYDLETDIGEQNNLADKYPDKVIELQRAFNEFEKSLPK